MHDAHLHTLHAALLSFTSVTLHLHLMQGRTRPTGWRIPFIVAWAIATVCMLAFLFLRRWDCAFETHPHLLDPCWP